MSGATDADAGVGGDTGSGKERRPGAGGPEAGGPTAGARGAGGPEAGGPDGSGPATKGPEAGAPEPGGPGSGSGSPGSRVPDAGAHRAGAEEWSGFRPGERLVELAEAVRRDPALPRAAMVGVLARHGESAADLREFTEADADELRAAVVHLTEHVLRETDVDRAALALNALLERCGARPRLSRHDGHAWHLHVDRGDDAGWADWFTASSALTLARLLGERGGLAWGECAAHGCAGLFLLHGPGAPRRYCSPTCASRARVAAHRRRRRESGA